MGAGEKGDTEQHGPLPQGKGVAGGGVLGGRIFSRSWLWGMIGCVQWVLNPD